MINALTRISSLILKEFTSYMRDSSMLLIGLFLPAVLIMVFGLGLSMDVKHVPIAVVNQSASPLATTLLQRLVASDYFRVETHKTRQAAEVAMAQHRVQAIVHVPATFDADAAEGKATLGLTVHAVDANQATMIRTYVNATLAQVLTNAQKTGEATSLFPNTLAREATASTPTLTLRARAWFNDANDSSWYLVPGLLVITMTLVGSFLTSLVVAREWERGTIESLFCTPLTPWELFLGKLLPNALIAMIGTLLALIVALTLFDLPVRGSIAWLATTMTVFQCLALIFGLFLSAHFKRQFLAMQFSIIGSFLPSIMLSGFLFDLRSVPTWISWVGHVLPPTYAMASLKICFLSGGSETELWRNLVILLLWCGFFTLLAVRSLKKTLDGGLHA
ncbi:MAG: ABC transporter permease [Sutterella sp.]|nr:ABC transporter permease [Sutterella sp.]